MIITTTNSVEHQVIESYEGNFLVKSLRESTS